MVDHPAASAKAHATGRNLAIVGLIVIILLLLLWWKNGRNVVNNTIINKGGDLDVPGLDIPRIDIPAPLYPGNVTLPKSGVWDWMQTTDCACDCDLSPKRHDFGNLDLPVIVTLSRPDPILVSLQPLAIGPLPTFDVYNPTPHFWWYEAGYNVHHEKATYIMTDSGVVGLRGKYSRSSDYGAPPGGYPNQSKNVTLQGDTCYIDGRAYIHDPKRDNFTYPNVGGGGGSSPTAWSR